VTRVAAVDLGTNSTRLLVADVEHGRVDEIVRRSVVTRLGEGVDARRRLLPVPVARVRNALSDFRRELESLGAERTLAVATSAVRDAENGEAFLGEVEWSYGFATRLLSGDEEADLTRRGVGALDGATLVLDVGGGSTELIAGGSRWSLDVGSVRLSERCLYGDPPADSELEAAAQQVRDLLPSLHVENAVGVAGTIAQLAMLAGRAVLAGNAELALAEVEDRLAALAALPLAERRRVPNLDPARAPVIVGGALIVREVLRRYGLAGLRFSVRDLLDGAALEAANLPAGAEGGAPPSAYTCC
jgi:exopolyphosphatase/guanosine-5'-triphosphate,3'-diphosphate pyrophosphatase